MAKLQSVSKHVADTEDNQRGNVLNLPSTELETIDEIPAAEVNDKQEEIETQETSIILETKQTSLTQAPPKSKDIDKGIRISKSLNTKQQKKNEKALSKKCLSDLGLSNKQNKYVFDNAAFEAEIDPYSMRFSDVVSMLIQDQIKEDIHPYGRGNLYRNAMDGPRPPSIYHDDGKLFMWAIVSLFILGIVGSAIVMSIMYKPEQDIHIQPPNTTAPTT